VAAAAMTVGLVGCGQGASSVTGVTAEHVGDATSYVIIDRSAREAGVRLDGVASEDAVLPVELSSTSQQELVGPAGRVPFALHPDEVVYVRGRDAHVQRGALDTDVARDRLAVVGPESAARALADEVGGVVDVKDGHLIVVGPDALEGIARAASPEGIVEVVPVAPADASGRPAFASDFAAGLTPDERCVLHQVSPTEAPRAFDVSAFVRSRMAEPADELLPEVADCTDPIVGVWVSREHYPTYGDWYRFELTVTRDARDPDKLDGVIRSRSWSGGAEVSLPVSCPDDDEESASFDWTVHMHGVGALSAGQVSFSGLSNYVESTRCGEPYRASRYNLDHFTGQLIDGGRFIQAVNNDGDRAVNEPHLFRRVSCQ
jgi:hypothetical protein